MAIARVRRVDLEGDGIVEIEGREWRVPYVIPGERVEVVPRSGPARGELELVRVVTPSPHRIAPGCRHFGPCGGCAWQHVAYPEQLRLKQRLLQDLLDSSLGSGAPRVLATLPTPDAGDVRGEASDPHGTPWRYRNKVHFVFGPGGRGRPLTMGHYRRRSRAVVPVVECPVHVEEGNRVAFALRDALERSGVPGVSGDTGDGVARHVVVRVAETSGDWLATLVATENAKPLRRVTANFLAAVAPPGDDGPPERRRQGRSGLFLNINDRPGPYLFGRETRHLAGERVIRETVAGIGYRLAPASFFQTNVRAARVLAAQVLDAVAGSTGPVLDLYAGVGLFALPLARGGREVTAVEENRDAIAEAVAAARENGIEADRFHPVAARVEAAMPRLSPRRAADAWDAVVLDPPRQGCPPAVLDWIVGRLRPARVVYVSCSPEALALDLARVPAAGYTIERVQPVDMFPHTAHIESVAVLSRR